MFGELPSWGLYVRHVDGLTLKNFRISIDAPDYRPGLVFDDVLHLSIQGLTIEGDDKPVILHNTEKFKMDREQVYRKI